MKSNDFQNSNTLKLSSSPYLLEHANNPVHWHEWSEETLDLAARLDKPLLISIGYAACHWCHVMAAESFEDIGVAEIMNTHFICVKIDREERPDLDQIYMNAAQIINGSGGWPLNAFAFPDGRPFYAGTYFPKMRWIQLLTQIRNVYKSDRYNLENDAEKITQGIRGSEVITLPGTENQIDKSIFADSLEQWNHFTDKIKGGTKGAPKFPLPCGWNYLLNFYHYTHNTIALGLVEKTLDSMAAGGIYDQIGGGFARYSVDEDWLVPHFEKMLYDNAQLISLYSHAFLVTQKPRYQEIVSETIDFVMRELHHIDGGFYASLNADSEKEEGKFYIWSYDQFHQALGGKLAKIIADFYQVIPEGNWENQKNILHYKTDSQLFAIKNNLIFPEFKRDLHLAKEILLAHRSGRIRPETDTKIIAAWNGLMITALVDAFKATKKHEYLKYAIENADFLLSKMLTNDGKLMRNFSAGKVNIDGFLDDYASISQACLALYQTTFDINYLHKAQKMVDYAIQHFKSKSGALFFFTSDDAQHLAARKMEISDNVIPASNSIMATVLYQLGALLSNENYTKMAERMLSVVQDKITTGGPYYSNWATLLAWFTHAHSEVVITGKGWESALYEMQNSIPVGVIYAGGTTENLPLLKGRVNTEKLQIFICTNKTCSLPYSDVEKAIESLKI